MTLIQPASSYPRTTHTLPSAPPAHLLATVREALDSLKALDVVCLDVQEKTSVADTFVIASGTSTRHVKAIADEVVRSAKRVGVLPLGCEGEREGEWILVDLGDVVAHIMLPQIRAFYALERLWTVGGEPQQPAHEA